jgi:hypothetical protein
MTLRDVALAHLVLAPLVVVLSCSGGDMSRIARSQYPPDFHYITKQEIRTKMGELAVQVVALDELLSRSDGPGPGERDAVLEILGRMRVLAGQLVWAGAKSSHPMLDRDAPRLRSDLDRAIAEVRVSSQPTYYAAGRVVGACSYCHVARHTGG